MKKLANFLNCSKTDTSMNKYKQPSYSYILNSKVYPHIHLTGQKKPLINFLDFSKYDTNSEFALIDKALSRKTNEIRAKFNDNLDGWSFSIKHYPHTDFMIFFLNLKSFEKFEKSQLVSVANKICDAIGVLEIGKIDLSKFKEEEHYSNDAANVYLDFSKPEVKFISMDKTMVWKK